MLSTMVSKKMGLLCYRPIPGLDDNTNFWKNGVFLIIYCEKNSAVNFHKNFKACLSCTELLLDKFS